MLTTTQQRFILMFIEDGDRDFNLTCTLTGILPSVASPWFRDQAFHKALDRAHAHYLGRLGYGPLLVIEDTLAIAHSDITKIVALEGNKLIARDMATLPRSVRTSIKAIEYGIAYPLEGEPFVYPKKIVMHDKLAALSKVAEWYDVMNHEAVKGGGGAAASEGPKRISGLVVRPPVSEDQAEAEKLLE